MLFARTGVHRSTSLPVAMFREVNPWIEQKLQNDCFK